jgi:hypothetical protein
VTDHDEEGRMRVFVFKFLIIFIVPVFILGVFAMAMVVV